MERCSFSSVENRTEIKYSFRKITHYYWTPASWFSVFCSLLQKLSCFMFHSELNLFDFYRFLSYFGSKKSNFLNYIILYRIIQSTTSLRNKSDQKFT